LAPYSIEQIRSMMAVDKTKRKQGLDSYFLKLLKSGLLLKVIKVSKSIQKYPKVSKSIQKYPKVSKSIQKYPKVSILVDTKFTNEFILR
jgi:hypothetical protein